jgi:hypothetical protein
MTVMEVKGVTAKGAAAAMRKNKKKFEALTDGMPINIIRRDICLS